MPDQPSESPQQPPGQRPESVEMLQQILQRLQRMEGGLSQHEDWLLRLQHEQRPESAPTDTTDAALAQPADAASPATASPSSAISPPQPPPGENDLRRLVGALTLERDRANRNLAEAERRLGDYQQELAGLKNQATDLQKVAAERDRQLTTLKNASAAQLSQARSLQADVHRQLQERQQQLQTLQARLQEIEQQTRAKDQRITSLQTALGEAAAKLESTATENAAKLAVAADSQGRWPRFARVTVALLIVAGLLSAGLTGLVYERARAGELQSAMASVILPGATAEALQRHASMAADAHDIKTTIDPNRGRIDVTATASSSAAALSRAEEFANAIMANTLTLSAVVAATPPASQPEGQRLTARIAETRRQLAGSSRPANVEAIKPDELVGQYKTLQAERRSTSEQLAELAQRMEARPVAPARVEITADQVAKGEAANPQLQSEVEALKQREEQLASRLRVSLDAAAVLFRSLRQTLTATDAEFEKLLKEEHPLQVAQQLGIIRDAMKTWDRAANDLESRWQGQRKLLEPPAVADGLAIQTEMQAAAKAFITATTNASVNLTRAVEAIGQGQDQTTKRLVLRNALLKQLSPVTAAEESVITAARSSILSDNVELTAIVQRLDALRRQVQQHRGQVVTGLRQERVNRLQHDNDTLLSQDKQEQARLTQRATQIDASLLQLGDQGVQAAATLAEQARGLSTRSGLQERQLQDLQQLISLHDDYAHRVAALPPPVPMVTPARLLARPEAGPALTTALLIGAIPVVATGLSLLIAAWTIASRRSQDTIEQYARSLKDMVSG